VSLARGETRPLPALARVVRPTAERIALAAGGVTPPSGSG
jgi:hypothetical protein